MLIITDHKSFTATKINFKMGMFKLLLVIIIDQLTSSVLN